MSSYVSKSELEISWGASASPSLGFGLSWQMRVVMEICSELGSGVVSDVGEHTECLRDRICLESESESEVGKGVPLQC